jgi:hypothetical protein
MSKQARSGAVTTLGGFFRLLELDVTDATAHPDAFEQLRRTKLHGIVLHNIYDETSLRRVNERLVRHEPPFLQTYFPEEFFSWFYGRNLNLADPDLAGYFDEAKVFNAQLDSLFPGSLSVTGYLADVLRALDGGRPFESPPGVGTGQRYMFGTIRCHLEGGHIPAHVDNEFALRRSYRHLRRLVEPPILSYVLSLAGSNQGGALTIFNFRQDTSGTFETSGPIEPDTTGLESVSFRIPSGSMMIIDSGRYLHELTPVVGNQPRWTLSSFMALSRSHHTMYCWG